MLLRGGIIGAIQCPVPLRPEASWRRGRLHPRTSCVHHLHVRAIRRLRERRPAGQRAAQFSHQLHQRRRQGDAATVTDGGHLRNSD